MRENKAAELLVIMGRSTQEQETLDYNLQTPDSHFEPSTPENKKRKRQREVVTQFEGKDGEDPVKLVWKKQRGFDKQKFFDFIKNS